MIFLVTAKCIKCGGSAIADTFEKARQLINHAVALSRGIKCGDNYNMVQEIKSQGDAKKTHKAETTKDDTPKPETTKPIIPDTPKPEKTKLTEKPKEKTKQTKSSV